MIPAGHAALQPATASNWRQSWREAVRDPRELLAMLGLADLAATISDDAAARFPLRVPRGFVARMRHGDPRDPLLRQVLPVLDEDRIVPGFGLDAKANSFVRLEFAFEELRGTERVHRRVQVRPRIYVRPGRRVAELWLEAELGDEIDFANDRPGEGVTLRAGADLRPTDRLRFGLVANRRWLDVEAEDGRSGRLFTADVARLRAAYTFNSRAWLRLIGQWVETDRDPSLYTFAVDDRSGSFAGSAVFAYKLNWQSVVYLGWSDGRELDEEDDLRPAERQLFLKLSYALQG